MINHFAVPNNAPNYINDDLIIVRLQIEIVMVFRTFDDISYGMVMGGSRVVLEFDMLRHPDERL